MALLLVLSEAICLFGLLRSPYRKVYPLLQIYVVLAIPVTLALRDDVAWLHHWYVLLGMPVAVLRLAAALEVAHRETEWFTGWIWLMPVVWFGGAVITGAVMIAHPPTSRAVLFQFVMVRRMSQLWQAAFLVMLQLWWIHHAGLYRVKDWIAAAFTLSAMAHGLVSFAAIAWGWSESSWPVGRMISWGGVAASCGTMGAIFLWPEVCGRYLLHTTAYARALWRGIRLAIPTGR